MVLEALSALIAGLSRDLPRDDSPLSVTMDSDELIDQIVLLPNRMRYRKKDLGTPQCSTPGAQSGGAREELSRSTSPPLSRDWDSDQDFR